MDEPQAPEAKVRQATQLIVARLRRDGRDDNAIRAQVTDGILSAFAGPDSGPSVGDSGDVPEMLPWPAVLFRLAFALHRVDWTDERIRERWFEVVQDELERALARVT